MNFSVYLLLIITSIVGQQVCGQDKTTYSSLLLLQQANTKVLHCGNCGSCSNANDINIYNVTRNTLTTTTTNCAYLSFFGRAAVERCMLKVGFTYPCLKCWVDNIICGININRSGQVQVYLFEM